MKEIQAVFFDLDGTLIDTAPDMGGALNRLLAIHDRPTLAADAIRPHVSNGANVLIKLGFGDHISDEELAKLRQEYLDIYASHLAEESAPFPGMLQTLEAIEEKGLPWGVITNKPGWLTEPLLKQLNLWSRCVCVVSADTCAERKPHPMPMFYACEVAGVTPENCLYVGDDLRDMQAGNAANMTTVAAAYGYIGRDEPISRWGAHFTIASPPDLLDLL